MSPIVRLRPLALFLCALLLAGCGNALQKVVRKDSSAPSGYVTLDAGEAAGNIKVFRGRQALVIHLPLMLQEGDIIETGPHAGAVLRLKEGEVVLGASTRLRLGSLEVFFGRIFASVRGLFRAEDGNVAADVEGTRFLFESRRGRGMRLMVVEGAVRCTSKRGEWKPQRVTAGHAMDISYNGRQQPHMWSVPHAEINNLLRWSESITRAPRMGFCCAGGRVYPALSNACNGHFERSKAAAEHQCERGWCCRNGRVTGGIRAECRGSFHRNRQAAKRACASPTGWCCTDGRTYQATRKQCKGRFFSNRSAAQQACAPQPTGWCCLKGKVHQTDRAGCAEAGGTFYPNRSSAVKDCSYVE